MLFFTNHYHESDKESVIAKTGNRKVVDGGREREQKRKRKGIRAGKQLKLCMSLNCSEDHYFIVLSFRQGMLSNGMTNRCYEHKLV